MIQDKKIGEIEVTNRTADTSQRKAAIVAGLGILLMIIPSIFANFFVVQGLIARGDAATTASNILAKEMLFRLGILSFIVVVVLDVVVAWSLYVFFQPVNRHLSLLTGWFRLVYATIFAIALINLAIALRYLNDTNYLAVFKTDQLQAQALLFLNAFADGWSIGYVFFSLHLIFLGYLVFKAGYMPKILGALLIIAGLGYMFDSITGFLFPDFGVAISQFTFIGELLLAIWLVIKGVSVKQWERLGLESA